MLVVRSCVSLKDEKRSLVMRSPIYVAPGLIVVLACSFINSCSVAYRPERNLTVVYATTKPSKLVTMKILEQPVPTHNFWTAKFVHYTMGTAPDGENTPVFTAPGEKLNPVEKLVVHYFTKEGAKLLDKELLGKKPIPTD